MFYVYQWRCIYVYPHFLSDIFSSAILFVIATSVWLYYCMLYGMNNETIWKKKKDPAKYYNKTDQNKNKNPTININKIKILSPSFYLLYIRIIFVTIA